MRMKLRRVRLGIAAMGLVIATSTDASNTSKPPSTKAMQRGTMLWLMQRRRICYVRRHPMPGLGERRVCRSVGGYSCV